MKKSRDELFLPLTKLIQVHQDCKLANAGTATLTKTKSHRDDSRRHATPRHGGSWQGNGVTDEGHGNGDHGHNKRDHKDSQHAFKYKRFYLTDLLDFFNEINTWRVPQHRATLMQVYLLFQKRLLAIMHTIMCLTNASLLKQRPTPHLAALEAFMAVDCKQPSIRHFFFFPFHLCCHRQHKARPLDAMLG
ncbi:hypothetical protein E2C01_057485 [Portunus trituberculatus]|uniref:Uncharacterized protein n=1 Tax=Portunus trituberculatus TaxID=210409 RepID=A0A5B7H208_PORTR|nr:hypothetical protein [Portunus trituberculatus]